MGINIQGRLPDFIAVGPPRTATTWLEWILKGRVGLPAGIKETDFFGNNYGLGVEWYKIHFSQCDPALPQGEICPVYFDSADVRERIVRHIPRARIIVTLRDPVERVYSHYRLLRHEGWLGPIPLEDALAKDLKWNGPGNLHGSNRYAAHLREWQRIFGAENVLVLLHEDLLADPQAYLDKVCKFIGIEKFKLEKSQARRRVNTVERAPRSPRLAKRARKIRGRLIQWRWYGVFNACQPLWNFCAGGGELFGPIDSDLAARIRAELRPEIETLEILLQRDLSNWKQIPTKGNQQLNTRETAGPHRM
jgi:hypothetical protein